MRRLLFVFLIACSGDTACPSGSLSCTEAGATCDRTLEDGRHATCRCDGRAYTCNDCPDGERPIGACAAGQACAVWGFESSCACSCGADGMWSCSVDDPDPNFHCAP